VHNFFDLWDLQIADKTAHFEAIKGWTSIDYSDMVSSTLSSYVLADNPFHEM